MSAPELNTIEIEIEGDLGILTLNRPEAFNAMSPELIGEMTIAFAWLADRAPIRALIVTGAGNAFCSGGDLNWFRKGIDDEGLDISSEVRRGAEALHQAIVDLRRIEYPVIAAVNGPAAGAGLSLALACDFRIAARSAFLACGYGRIGASPDGGMTYFLPRIVGPGRALELLLDDPDMDAERGLAEGLLSEVVADDELPGRAREKAAQLSRKAPFYVKMSKQLIGQTFDNSLTAHLQVERHGIADSLGTEDARIGITAFFAGEKADFSGS